MRVLRSRGETRLAGSNRSSARATWESQIEQGACSKPAATLSFLFSLFVAGSRATREAPVRGDASITRSINPSRDEYERVQPRSCP